MLICLYDASLDGFLTVFFDCYKRKVIPDIITTFDSEYQLALDCEIVETITEQEKAERIEKGFIQKMDGQSFSGLIKAFCSGKEEKERIIFKYLLMVFKFGKKTESMFNDLRVIQYNEMLSAVNYEIHRMAGFIRFKDVVSVQIGENIVEGEIYYAPFSPDNNIIEFVTEYFTQRNADMQFIIHDVLVYITVGTGKLYRWMKKLKLF